MSGEPATAAAASSSEIQEKFSAEVVRAALNLLKLNQENLIDQSNSSFHDPEVGLQSMLKYLNYSNPNLAQNLVPAYEGVPDSVEYEVNPHNVTQSAPKESAVEFVVYGILLVGVGILGLLGNVISIVVLTRPQMKSSINIILVGLVSCDSILIVTSILMFGIKALSFNYEIHVFPYICGPVVYPVGLIAQSGSCYLTLAVTIERYLAVCWPLKARHLCSQGRSKLAVAVFLGISIIYNIPRWLEITWTPAETGVGAYASPTQLRENKDYIDIYVNWMYLVFMYIIPFSCLAILNLLTFLEIRRASQRRARLSSQEQKEHNLATMFLVVVLVFFICNALPLVNNIMEAVGGLSFADIPDGLLAVANLFVTINSSINFLIYCLFGNKFRTIFMQIFCCRPLPVQNNTTFHPRAALNKVPASVSSNNLNSQVVHRNGHSATAPKYGNCNEDENGRSLSHTVIDRVTPSPRLSSLSSTSLTTTNLLPSQQTSQKKLSDVKPDCVPDVEPQAQLSNNEISGLCSTPLTNGDLLNKYTTKSNGKLPSIENDKRRRNHHHHQPNHKKRCRHRCHHCHHHFGHSQLTTSAPFGNNVLGGRTHARSKSCSTTELDTIIPMLQSHADGGSSEGKTTSEDDEGSNAAVSPQGTEHIVLYSTKNEIASVLVELPATDMPPSVKKTSIILLQ